jgi:HEAT repeat protein
MKTLVKVVGVVLCMAATVQAADVAELTIRLRDKDPEVRRAAAKAAGEMGADAKALVPSLSFALKDND